MATVISTTFKLKRGTAARWQELNLVLSAGEPGFELDTYRLKIGDGETAWNDLPYIGVGSGGGGDIIVDTVLSNTSLNPIANKTVKAALDSLEALIAKEHYNFSDGFIVTEDNGIKTIKIDENFFKIDTEDFATKEELRELAAKVSELIEQIAAIKIPQKLSELENDKEFITIKEVEDKGYLTEIPEDYAKKTDIPSLEGYAKISDIPSLDGYAKVSDIPSLEGYATESFVREEIGKIQLPEIDTYTKEEIDEKDKDLKDYIDEEISKIAVGGDIDLTAYAKKEYVDQQLAAFTPIAIAYGDF